ncbi:MAG TPA: nuclear transport factor 2 family protein [Dongiaceae bacterium]|jgi:steroid delta-isomerase-like uncharacterized protein|nr:nuclear transport factor 2 family protein [Dongiaceae bacterium]
MTQTELNKQTVTQYVAAFNRADMDTLRTLFTPDAVIRGVLGWGNLDQVIPVWRELHAAFAIELTIDSIAAEGDQVAVRYTERGKSVGAFRGMPVTGQAYELVAMEWFEMRAGKIYRRWGARDSASQNRQMGLPLA